MSNLDFQSLIKMIDAFIDEGDPSDPKERKKKRILDAATGLFIKQGYRKTSIDEVAAASGVAKGTVYLYFKSKTDLLMRAIAVEKRRYFEEIRPVFDPGVSPRERLRRWIRTALILATKMPLVSKLLGGDRELLTALDDVDQGQKLEWDAVAQQFLGQMLDQAAAPHKWSQSELVQRATVLKGLPYFSALIADQRIRGSLTLESFAQILADMIVDGIGKSDGAPSRGSKE